jgi:hypothetical protein
MTCIETVDVISGAPCGGASVKSVEFGLPCPSISAFSYSANMGVLRTSIATGHARQRRLFKDQPRTYELNWLLTTSQLNQWETFAQQYGYDWHFLPMVTGQVPDWHPAEHPIRYISNFEVNLAQRDLWEVTVQAEQHHINPECYFELYCDILSKCINEAQFKITPAPDWVAFGASIGDKASWSNFNG